ncbi:MAG: hotdog fold thioesterase [Saprospiraceae bacterium]|nr:hotdog fold thioesterase [Saprospiraceae bacterium]MBK8668278.1 hotdog fold thioesterase [Saprospiraceae bacterium]MBL0099245.1 hotdog fold thioesterase [Saprospiraceae bacterium]
MTGSTLALKIVHRLMYENDAFSKWMNLRIDDVGPGRCTVSMEIRPEMLNGFKICHGGVTFSIADSAFAFASNSHGIQAVSIETSISHIKMVHPGDIITATATEQSLSQKLAIYHVDLTNQLGEKVALFKGTVYRTGKEWEL